MGTGWKRTRRAWTIETGRQRELWGRQGPEMERAQENRAEQHPRSMTLV